MAWYDQNKNAQWKIYLQKEYHIQHLLHYKDIVIQELPKVDELQRHLKINSLRIIRDCLDLCLHYPPQNSSYDRKYVYPTKSIEIITNQVFFSSLGWNKELIQEYVRNMFKCFETVNPNAENINLYHAYFERILKMLFVCRVVDKLDVVAALESQLVNNNALGILYKHNHKLSIAFCLEMMLTVDLIEPLLCFSLDFKKSIITNISSTLEMFANKGQDVQKTQNCMQILKGFIQKGIHFLAGINCSNQPLSPLFSTKIDHFCQLYSIIQVNFNTLANIIQKSNDNFIKIPIFQLLQLNEILLSQPQLKKRQMNMSQYFKQSKQLINYMMSLKLNLVHGIFLDWLIISISERGLGQQQIQMIYNCKLVQTVIKMMLENRSNNIIACKIYKLLKVIFHHIAQSYIIANIQKYKNVNTNLINFDLLHHFVVNLKPIQTAVQQFKAINDPLFSNLFNIYKVVSQYCQSIDTIFNLYIHIDMCKNTKPLLASVILFQRNQPCFNVYEKEIVKDLGTFYSDDMFIDQKPLQFTVKPLKANEKPTPIAMSSHDAQAIIQIPTTSYNPPVQVLPLTPITKAQSQPKVISEQININLPSQSSISLQTSKQQEIVFNKVDNTNDQQQGPNRFTTFMRNQLKQISSNEQSRRTKSRTPTKIKNELKKAKNKWINSQDEAIQTKKPFSSEVKQRTKSNDQKVRNLDKICLIRVPKSKVKANQGERQLCKQRDSRLIRWLSLRA